MADVFVHGGLAHPPLIAAVLQRSVEETPATLSGYAIYSFGPFSDGALMPDAPGLAAGAMIGGLDEADVARLDFFMACHGAFPEIIETGRDAPLRAWVTPTQERGGPWDAAEWERRWAAVATATAGDIMALFGARGSAEVRARLPLMMVRGASRVRAGGGATTLRRDAHASDVAVVAHHQPYARYFAVEEYDLAFRRFDGSFSAEVNRAVFISGDAVTVLPYDPVRDRVLLIEQFRSGPFARGDDQPWSLEPIAGRIDPGETPEEAARREAVEEAGLRFGDLLRVAEYYPSPAAKAEYLYSYVALADLPDGSAGTFGLAEEAEDIRGHLIGFERLMDLVESGEVANGPLVLTALWLARARAGLRV